VVGHSNCGGVRAALEDQRVGLVDNWLRHVQDVRHMHTVFIDSVAPERQVDALVELNVLEQARNVCHTTVVQDAWKRGQEVVIHGWVYGLHNGLLQDLKMTVRSAEDVPSAYGLALGALKQRYDKLNNRRG
jgi:carbonic anhydrase